MKLNTRRGGIARALVNVTGFEAWKVQPDLKFKSNAPQKLCLEFDYGVK